MQKASLLTTLEASMSLSQLSNITFRLNPSFFSHSTVLLQLHRQFFTRALSGPEEMNRRHKYAPSVVAVVLSASRMIATVQDLYDREPHLTVRILGYWSNAFSAAVSIVFIIKNLHATFPVGGVKIVAI